MVWFTPRKLFDNTPIPKVTNRLLSDELFNKLWEKTKARGKEDRTQWIFLLDCVSRETITPMEAYDCLKLGYVMEHLTVRIGAYITSCPLKD